MELQGVTCYETNDIDMDYRYDKRFRKAKQLFYKTGNYNLLLKSVPKKFCTRMSVFLEHIEKGFVYYYIPEKNLVLELEILDWNPDDKIIYFNSMEKIYLEENENLSVNEGVIIREVVFDT